MEPTTTSYRREARLPSAGDSRLGHARESGDHVNESVLGVDGCSGGWIGVVLEPAGAASAMFAPRIGDLVAAAKDVSAVAVDIPIHLNESKRRECDKAARKFLPGKKRSVFPAPLLAVMRARTYDEAKALSRAVHEDGKALSKQTWELVPKIEQVEEWRGTSHCPVHEIHPEVSFAAMVGAPILLDKKTPEGALARRAALAGEGLTPPTKPLEGKLDDLLDAMAAAWSARRIAMGTCVSLPDPPVVVRGQHQASWY
jgi:predicted RNase H-like nuclease